MSGPIVRKYGFPNHEQIFGPRPDAHGVDKAKPEGEKPAEPEAEDRKPEAPARKGDQASR